ncbi:MAG: response regulator [Proteobacteria bacterium]|jgi:signal transduction histidine kinase/CheY-like chemotaxis protein|nr:ATP-binding protein [Alphaproteobacteria bacterium]NCC03818.1 response regulator [Pseudomonadota bacterium]
MVKFAALLGGGMILIFVLTYLGVSRCHSVMVTEREREIRYVVETALSIASFYEQKAERGDMRVQDAQEQAKDVLRAIRYGREGYVSVYAKDGRLLVHPIYKEQEGRPPLDEKGKAYVEGLIRTGEGERKGASYFPEGMDEKDKDSVKMSYVRVFKPWEWVVTTGIKISRIEEDYNQRAYHWFWILVPIYTIIFILGLLLVRTIIGPVRQLESAKAQAEEASKAKRDFLSNMSHEIRTPLNGLMGMLALLLGTRLLPQQKEWAKVAYQSSEELLNLINDILDISKIESGHMELESVPFDLQTTVKTVTDILYFRAHHKGVDMQVAFQSDLPRFVLGDPVRLRQILLNLVGNAVKFTSQGYILISVEGAELPEGYELKFEIRDTGCGIPNEKQHYIFQKFTQAEEASTRLKGGSGLGLAICTELVRMMGGKLGLRSVVGQGSTFWFTVRLGKAENPATVVPLASDMSGGRVLVDCRQENMKKILCGYLSSWTYQCTVADESKGLQSSLQQAVALGQPFTLVCLDVEGYADNAKHIENQIEALANLSPTTQFILITPPDRVYSTEEIHLRRSVGLLSKPIFPQELFDVIGLLYEERQKGGQTPSFLTPHEGPFTVPIIEPIAKDKERERVVLVAEDQKVNQMLMKTMLQQMGCAVDIASNGIEAVRMAAEKEYDVIFMDGHMPEMDGLEATKQIREFEARLRRHTPIVALTADAMKGDRDICIAAGMDDYLHKPVKAAQIKEMIDKYAG